jgi:hypothetical protein
MNIGMVRSALDKVGLSDPRVLANADFVDADELLRLLFPDAETLPSADLLAKVQDLLDRAVADGELHEKVLRPSGGGGLDDALWAAETFKKNRDQDLEKEVQAALVAPRLDGTRGSR